MAMAGALVVGGHGAIAGSDEDLAVLKELFRRPLSIPFPEKSPYSPQMATLGKMLFFDPRLSRAENVNCVSCHNPSFGYETSVPKAVGAAIQPVERHTPTLLNAAWAPHLNWDGSAPDLEHQAAGPIIVTLQMNGRFDAITQRLSAIPEYKSWFERLFPGVGVTRNTILQAIATYERTIVSGWAPFDRWVEGDENAIADAAKRGFLVFNGKAGCSGCHSGWNFTDYRFHDVGLDSVDLGRLSYDPLNIKSSYAFKTPGLRNLTHRAPFMHDGSLPDLGAVIDHFQTGGQQRRSLSDGMKPFRLSDEERRDLMAFLESLTAEKTQTAMPILPN
jgi:cytochrome c peroxidase